MNKRILIICLLAAVVAVGTVESFNLGKFWFWKKKTKKPKIVRLEEQELKPLVTVFQLRVEKENFSPSAIKYNSDVVKRLEEDGKLSGFRGEILKFFKDFVKFAGYKNYKKFVDAVRNNRKLTYLKSLSEKKKIEEKLDGVREEIEYLKGRHEDYKGLFSKLEVIFGTQVSYNNLRYDKEGSRDSRLSMFFWNSGKARIELAKKKFELVILGLEKNIFEQFENLYRVKIKQVSHEEDFAYIVTEGTNIIKRELAKIFEDRLIFIPVDFSLIGDPGINIEKVKESLEQTLKAYFNRSIKEAKHFEVLAKLLNSISGENIVKRGFELGKYYDEEFLYYTIAHKTHTDTHNKNELDPLYRVIIEEVIKKSRKKPNNP